MAKCIRAISLAVALTAADLTLAQAPRPEVGRAAAPGRGENADARGGQSAAEDVAWREAAAMRIDRHRKADLAVRVEDAAGRPIGGASVAVRMKRHRFGFGALIGSERWNNRPTSEDARRHLALVANHFNKAVTILKPGDPAGAAALDWLNERKIRVRGHYLMWAPVQPDRGRGGQPAEVFGMPAKELIERADARRREEIRTAAFTHIERMLEFAGTRVAEWDAINHIALDGGVRYSDLLGPSIYADVIRRARELALHAEMWVNEGAVLTNGQRVQKYHDVIADLIRLGAKPDGIGFMSHFREGEFTHPEEIYRRLDRFAALVANLQLTELDIDTADEQLQADFMRDILTVAFSHPAVSGIVLWQVWGRGAQNKALWRPDWSIKPAGQAWLDKVFGEWWTNAAGTTDAQGSFTTRGFVGDYEISVRVEGETRMVAGQLVPGAGLFRVVF